MGFMTGSGCLSRVMGPVFVTYIYEEYGTIWTFGFTTVMMFICLIWLVFFRKIFELVEPKPQNLEEGQELKGNLDFESIVLDSNKEIKQNGNISQ